MDDETVIRLRRVILRLARHLNAASVGEGLTPTQGEQAYQRIAAQRAAILSERVAGLPPEQAAALIAALPALENLAEDLRAVVRRGRIQAAREERNEAS